MNWEIVIVCGLASVVILAWCYIAHVVFEHGEKVRRAKRDVNLAALKLAGQDVRRPLDIWV